MKKRNIGSATLALLALGALSAQAALLSHEDFSAYARDGVTQLDADIPSPATAGYVSNWVHASTSFGTGDIVSQPGGYVSGNDGFAAGTSGRVARQLDPALCATSETEGTLYLGWLFRMNGTSAVTYEMLALYDGIANTDSDGSRNFDAGATENGALGGGVYGFGADNSYTSSGVSLDTGWHLLVARFDLSSIPAGDSVTFWVDPTSEDDPSVTSSSKDLTWDTLTLSDYDDFTGSWDDIKWGTTFADVLTAIPANPPSVGAKSPVGTATNATPTITAEIIDGTYPVVANTISMYLDDVLVSHSLTQSLDTTTNYVSYTVPSPLDPGSSHTVKIVADDTEPSIAPVTNSWTFTVQNSLVFVSGSPSGLGASDMPTLEAVIADGLSELNTASVSLYLDGTNVPVDSTNVDVPVAGQTTVVGTWGGDSLVSGSTHTGMVVYAGINPAAGPFTNTWTFTASGDPGFGIYITDTNAPVAGADDIYQFEAPGADWENIGGVVNGSNITQSGQNDASTYVANDRSTQGQIFTTGSGAAGYTLSSVWVKHVGYTNFLDNGTWASLNPGNAVTIRIVDPAQADTASFVVYSNSLLVVSNSIVANGTGTGYWMEYKLSVPVALAANKQYGFDLTSYGPWFELAGMGSNDWYTGGNAYSTASKEALNLGTVHSGGDRTFMIELTPSSASVSPDILSIVVSGGSATLMWESETGANYGVLSKSSLTAGTWTEVTNVTGSGASTMATVPAASATQFFKIEGN